MDCSDTGTRSFGLVFSSRKQNAGLVLLLKAKISLLESRSAGLPALLLVPILCSQIACGATPACSNAIHEELMAIGPPLATFEQAGLQQQQALAADMC